MLDFGLLIDTDFPGIFAYSLPFNTCWSLDNKRILMNTNWKNSNVKSLSN